MKIESSREHTLKFPHILPGDLVRIRSNLDPTRLQIIAQGINRRHPFEKLQMRLNVRNCREAMVQRLDDRIERHLPPFRRPIRITREALAYRLDPAK